MILLYGPNGCTDRLLKVIKPNTIAFDDNNAERLWQITEELTATSTTV